MALNISSLPTQSWHKFGKKRDASFSVSLMLNLPWFRNSWTALYKQYILAKRRYLAFEHYLSRQNDITGITSPGRMTLQASPFQAE